MKNLKNLLHEGKFIEAAQELSHSNEELGSKLEARLRNLRRQFNMGVLEHEQFSEQNFQVARELARMFPQITVKQPFIFVHFSDVFKEVSKEEATGVAIIVDEGGIDTENQYIANWKITNWDEL